MEPSDAEPFSLWYDLPQEFEEYLPANDDHLMVGLAFFVMQIGEDVRFHGELSPSLQRNLEEFRAAWSLVRGELSNVEVCADRENEPSDSAGREGAVVAFSGGVDSCFTAFRHANGQGLRFPRAVRAGVMVHGFDIPLEEPEVFQSAFDRAARITESLGLDLVPVATNYRDVVDDWTHSHGAAVAATLALLAGGFREGLIGQTFTYEEIRHLCEGVNALTDPMLSSDAFTIVPDGAAFERADKIFALREWPEFLEHARVCWQGLHKDRNCCECEKCIRNILTFRALGLGLPACFEKDVDDGLIREFRPGDVYRAHLRYGKLGAMARASGADGPWVMALDKRLAALRQARRSRLRHLPRRAVRRLKTLFLKQGAADEQ